MSRLVIACETVVLMGLLVATASAKPVTTSFDQIRFVVQAGQTITVRDVSGDRIKGEVLSASPTSIALLVKGQRRDLTEADVRQIHVRRRDSRKRDALIAAALPALIARNPSSKSSLFRRCVITGVISSADSIITV